MQEQRSKQAEVDKQRLTARPSFLWEEKWEKRKGERNGRENQSKRETEAENEGNRG